MNNPLVSICCLAFNHKKYINQALNGFLIQKTTFPIEILIHDDASTDGTAEIIKEYEKKYPDLIKPIYQIENQYSKGISISYSFNFPRAKSKYIALCEGDDYWTDPNKLQKQVDFLENNPDYIMCFHPANMFNESGSINRIMGTEIEKTITTSDIIRKDAFIPTASIVFRNVLDKELHDFTTKNNIISGDQYLHLYFALKGNIKQLPDIMSRYRIHDGGISSYGDFCKIYKSDILLYKKMKQKFPRHYGSDFNYKLFNIRYRLSRICLQKGKRRDGFINLIQIIQHIKNLDQMILYLGLIKIYIFSMHFFSILRRVYG